MGGLFAGGLRHDPGTLTACVCAPLQLAASGADSAKIRAGFRALPYFFGPDSITFVKNHPGLTNNESHAPRFSFPRHRIDCLRQERTSARTRRINPRPRRRSGSRCCQASRRCTRCPGNNGQESRTKELTREAIKSRSSTGFFYFHALLLNQSGARQALRPGLRSRSIPARNSSPPTRRHAPDRDGCFPGSGAPRPGV